MVHGQSNRHLRTASYNVLVIKSNQIGFYLWPFHSFVFWQIPFLFNVFPKSFSVLLVKHNAGVTTFHLQLTKHLLIPINTYFFTILQLCI